MSSSRSIDTYEWRCVGEAGPVNARPGLPTYFGVLMVDNKLIEELNAHWQLAEDYNAFEKLLRSAIAKAFNVPAHLLERQTSYNRILTGEFTVVEGRHKRPLIVVSEA